MFYKYPFYDRPTYMPHPIFFIAEGRQGNYLQDVATSMFPLQQLQNSYMVRPHQRDCKIHVENTAINIAGDIGKHIYNNVCYKVSPVWTHRVQHTSATPQTT